MNETKLLDQARNLILNEGWSIRKVCKKYGVTRAWLRSKLETLEDKALNEKLKDEEPVNEAAVTLPNEPISLAAPIIEFDADDFGNEILQFIPQAKETNIKIKALVNYRLIHGLNMQQFAKKCGLDPSTISKLEKHNRKMSEKTKRFILAGVNLTLEEFNAYADKIPVKKPKAENKPNLEAENERLLIANTELQNENYTLNKKLDEAKQAYKLLEQKDAEIALLKNDINAMKGTIKKIVEERNALVKEVQELKTTNPVELSGADAETLEKQKRVIAKQAEEIKRLNKILDRLLG